MSGIASVLYGAVVYLLFFGTFLYAIAFTATFRCQDHRQRP